LNRGIQTYWLPVTYQTP